MQNRVCTWQLAVACLKKASAACTERKQLPEFLGKALMLKIIKRNRCSKWGSCFTRAQEIAQWKCQRGTWVGTPGAGEMRFMAKLSHSWEILLPTDLTGYKVCSLSLAGLVLLRGLSSCIVVRISCNSDFKHQQGVTRKDHSSCRMQHCIMVTAHHSETSGVKDAWRMQQLVVHCCNCTLQYLGHDLQVFLVFYLRILIWCLIMMPKYLRGSFCPHEFGTGYQNLKSLGSVMCCFSRTQASMGSILEVVSDFRCYNSESYGSRHCSAQVLGKFCRGPSLLISFW